MLLTKLLAAIRVTLADGSRSINCCTKTFQILVLPLLRLYQRHDPFVRLCDLCVLAALREEKRIARKAAESQSRKVS